MVASYQCTRCKDVYFCSSKCQRSVKKCRKNKHHLETLPVNENPQNSPAVTEEKAHSDEETEMKKLESSMKNLQSKKEDTSIQASSNVEKVSSECVSIRGKGKLDDHRSWWKCLKVAERYEWFVDCYRMRVDDDYVWGGGNFHGLYSAMVGEVDDPELEVVKDFYGFVRMAKKNEVLPEEFDFSLLLEKAKDMLGYAFEKSDAKEKYGGENVFSVLVSGRPSLRYTAERICGTSGRESYNTDHNDESEAMEKFCEEFERAFYKKKLNKICVDLGGAEIWKELVDVLDINGAQPMFD